jgi:menaquinone-dependent protoporphyrinogen oxidase
MTYGLPLARSGCMRVLVTWGKLGGAAEAGGQIARALEEAGHEVVAASVREAPPLRAGFSAVVVGSALYASRWRPAARHWVEWHVRDLENVPTWLFTVGQAAPTEPPREVDALMTRIGAIDHATFSGPDDEHIRDWAALIARELPTATPRPVEVLHGHALPRLFEYGAYGWAVCSLVLGVLLPLTRPSFAIGIHLIVTPMVFALLARRYQSAEGARAPFGTAVVWTLMVGVLDAVIMSAVVRQDFSLVRSGWAFWAPLVLLFLGAWGFGAGTAVLPPVTNSDVSPTARA